MSVRTIHTAIDNELGERKDGLGKGVTWPIVIETGIQTLENGKKEKEIPNYHLRVAPDKEVLVREFDVVEDNQWRTKPLPEIEPGQTFRIRDDGRVLTFEDFKRFILVKQIFAKNGHPYVEVKPLT